MRLSRIILASARRGAGAPAVARFDRRCGGERLREEPLPALRPPTRHVSRGEKLRRRCRRMAGRRRSRCSRPIRSSISTAWRWENRAICRRRSDARRSRGATTRPHRLRARCPGQRTATEERATTRVRFYPLEPAEIAEYVATGEPLDKAGAYGIQGRAAALVEAIDGDFYTVMGLPLARFVRALRRSGFTLPTRNSRRHN